jgi:hypothetical protein
MVTPTGIIITVVIIMGGMAIRIRGKGIIRKNRALRAVPGSRFWPCEIFIRFRNIVFHQE